MKKAILPIIIGYSAIIMLSGCQSSNDESNISTVINSDILNESSSSQSSAATSSSNKDNGTNSSSTESRNENNSSSVSSTSNINQSDISSESNGSQSNVTTSSSNKDNGINSSPNESKNENNSSSTSDKNISNTTSESNNSQTEAPNSTSSESSATNSMPSGNNVLEPGTVEIIDELLELKRDGQARGEIEPGMKIDYRKATLTKGSNVTFNIDCKQKLTTIKITLTDRKNGKYFEGSTTGKGVISFNIDTDGEYVVLIENCSDKATYFTIEYRIGDETNSI